MTGLRGKTRTSEQKETQYFFYGCKRQVKLIKICTENNWSKLHQLIKMPSELVFEGNFERSPSEKLYFAHWTINWQKMNPETASHTLIFSLNTSGELKKNDKKPKFIALTLTWLTKLDTEQKQLWKTGRSNLTENYGIAKCSSLLSKPRDTDR